MMNKEALVIVALAYLVGSIPFGLILSKLFAKRDIRSAGSGNIGATNVMRVLGKKLGVLTLMFDILKGAIFVILAEVVTHSEIWASLAGLAAFLGHLYPIYLNFRGGKGVATSVGIFLFLAPYALLVDIVIFLLVVYQTRYVSLGSIIAKRYPPGEVRLFTVAAASEKAAQPSQELTCCQGRSKEIAGFCEGQSVFLEIEDAYNKCQKKPSIEYKASMPYLDDF
jgi:glycerol-3-phosphate acyltransferase PlsY